MADQIDVVLVDGVGRPRVLTVPNDDLPAIMTYAHEGIASGPDRQVCFEWNGEVDDDGRAVYRQAGKGAPMVRVAYLTLTPIVSPFNPPKVS